MNWSLCLKQITVMRRKIWKCGFGTKLSMHLPAQLSEWQSRHRKNDKCKNGMSACHLRSIWIFAAGIGGSKLREWADEKCLITDQSCTVSTYQWRRSYSWCIIIYFVHLTNPAATLGQLTTCRKQNLEGNEHPFGKERTSFTSTQSSSS